jgi:hypothetical protein
MAGMVEAHNMARANVMPPANPAIPPLTWSSCVAATAQEWANQCMFSHNLEGTNDGQNIYAVAGTTSTPAQVVASWVAEASNYTYATNTCAAQKVCGHYTQVVWRNTMQVGCAVQNCTMNSPFGAQFPDWQIWVCNYAPAGNFVGQKPY